MLDSYHTVYFKPTGGTGGANIIRIRRKANGYQIQYHTKKSFYPTLDRLYRKLREFARNQSYLLQKGIDLARTHGRPFDIRVMVQKTNKGAWKSTAMFTKIGNPHKVATNYNQGGKIGYLAPTLAGAGFSKSDIRRTEHKLAWMGVAVGHVFDRHSRQFRELGLDVALDTKGRSWILEVNTRPQIYPLKTLKSRTLYHRILHYARQYGRTR